MRVNVGELLADRHAVRLLSFCERLEPPADDVALPGAVEGELVLSSTGRTICLTGQVRTVVGLVCGACLTRFEQPLEAPVSEEFCRPGPTAEAAHGTGCGGGTGHGGPAHEDLAPEDFLVPVEPGDIIDVTEVVRQNLILALPIAPRCREDCRGLCPRCGADRNRTVCGCTDVESDPRLRPLERWSSRRGQGE